MLVEIEQATRSARHRPGDTAPAYAAEIAKRLEAEIEGEVRFDAGTRALYSTDASNYRQVPVGVVLPRSIHDVITTVEICRSFEVPVLSRGGGTSLAGQCCNVAVVLDFSKYLNHLLELDPAKRLARVEPGIILDELRDRATRHGLTFGPDPATHNRCTLGGMIGNNSCGVHALIAGKTSENVEEMEVLTYEGLRLRVGKTPEEDLARIIGEGGRRGEIYKGLRSIRDRYAMLIREKFPQIPRRVSGYNLDKLLPENGFQVAQALVGTESTCVTVLEATLRLIPNPECRTLVVLGYPDIYTAADDVPLILHHKPIGLEGMDNLMIDNARKQGIHPQQIDLLPEGKAWMMVEFGADTKEEADSKAHEFLKSVKKSPHHPNSKFFDNSHEEKSIWEVRESALGSTAIVPGQAPAWPGWEDSAVPPAQLGHYLRDLCSLYEKFGYRGAFYGHFGDGCVHSRVDFDLLTAEGIARFRNYVHEAAALVVKYGGSLSGEHGDGQARGELLPIMFGDELVQAFREFKAIWDPHNKMNPHKVVDAYRVDENLRLGSDYRPAPTRTHFQFPEDNGDFAHAALRCVGVGMCRRHDGGTMCPSYMVTHEEEHSTRGRARLLFEMLEGEVITEGWKSEAVKEALDLCLSCKGCKHDCPVSVDMATYKAEFLSHYYKGRRRPLNAYAIGFIHSLARLASLAPELANGLMHTPGLSGLLKRIAGIARQRQFPRFAKQTFKHWFAAHGAQNVGGPPVILWPDTFTNFWHPEHGIAATEVLEKLGYHVRIPRKDLCCGRPLYDYGMLGRAHSMLLEIIDVLRPAIQAGTPIVGIEPSCIAVFRDEIKNLLPKNQDAQRLSTNFFTLAEFLDTQKRLDELPKLHRKAIVHGHCHQKSVMTMDADRKLYEALGLDFDLLDSGCCGMAGGFGFEETHYQISIACGERVLFPRVRGAASGTLLIADGFSCETQIQQGTGRKALHVAQIVQMALRDSATAADATDPPRRLLRPLVGSALAACIGIGVAASTYVALNRRLGIQ